jgi:tRNA uridine 5-carboxymethylaminomethyl modification enzyme
MAGLNAALACAGTRRMVLDRADGYLGVMIDDLVTLGAAEPYRMFTSRAEYRLLLRADNADQRLTSAGIDVGCVSAARAARFKAKRAALEAARELLSRLTATPGMLAGHGLAAPRDGKARSARRLLGHRGIDIAGLGRLWPELTGLGIDIVEQMETEARYAGYLERQQADIQAFRRDEALVLPDNLDFATVGGLSNEAREKLVCARPATLGAAGRISGVTPAALIALLHHVRRGHVRRGHEGRGQPQPVES